MRKLYILLTRTESIASKMVRFFTMDKYTHASLGFDRELIELYSSGRKKGLKMFPGGPCKEGLDKGFFGRDPHTPCVVYEFSVTEAAFNEARALIDFFMTDNHLYKFSILGTFACKLGIQWTRKNKYFCSQFVAEILRQSNAVKLPKPPSLMRPIDYASIPEFEKIFEGTIGEFKEKKTATV
ncbi:MAG: hypothetical protein J6Q74_00395 [Clostridia bacterium]|nr:hypothetical protein [Clostridia bacterium]